MSEIDPTQPNYRFADNKLYITSGNRLITFDGQRATVAPIFGIKTMLILGLIFGYIPLIAFINIAAQGVASRDSSWIFSGIFALVFLAVVFRIVIKGKQAVAGGLSALGSGSGMDAPADLNDAQYLSHLRTIYHKEMKKQQAQQPYQQVSARLMGWCLLLVIGAAAVGVLYISCQRLIYAISQSRNNEIGDSKGKESPAVKVQRLTSQLAGAQPGPDGLKTRISLSEKLSSAQTQNGNLEEATKTYDQILSDRFQMLAEAKTQNNYELQLRKIAGDAVYRTECAASAGKDPDLTGLEKRILDAISASCAPLKLDPFEEKRYLVRQVAGTTRRRQYPDLAKQTNQFIAALSMATPEEKHRALAEQLHTLLVSVQNYYPKARDAGADKKPDQPAPPNAQPAAERSGAGNE